MSSVHEVQENIFYEYLQDNPGWHAEVDLRGTLEKLMGAEFENYTHIRYWGVEEGRLKFAYVNGVGSIALEEGS